MAQLREIKKQEYYIIIRKTIKNLLICSVVSICILEGKRVETKGKKALISLSYVTF